MKTHKIQFCDCIYFFSVKKSSKPTKPILDLKYTPPAKEIKTIFAN